MTKSSIFLIAYRDSADMYRAPSKSVKYVKFPMTLTVNYVIIFKKATEDDDARKCKRCYT